MRLTKRILYDNLYPDSNRGIHEQKLNFFNLKWEDGMQEQRTQSTTLGAALATAIAGAETFIPKSTNRTSSTPLMRVQGTNVQRIRAKNVTAKLRQEEFTLVFCGKFQKFIEEMNDEVQVQNECGGRTKSTPGTPALESYNLAKVMIDDLLCRVAVRSINILMDSREFYKVYVNCIVGKEKGFGVWGESNRGVYEKFVRNIAGLTYCDAKFRENNDKSFLVLREHSLRGAEVKIRFAIEMITK